MPWPWRRPPEGLRQDLKNQTTQAGLGPRLAGTWQGRVYPNNGLDAAAVVHTGAPTILNTFAA
ncbi:MAG: hypothetical protein ABT940_11620, partial [Alphaproteobacteria bacterium]